MLTLLLAPPSVTGVNVFALYHLSDLFLVQVQVARRVLNARLMAYMLQCLP